METNALLGVYIETTIRIHPSFLANQRQTVEVWSQFFGLKVLGFPGFDHLVSYIFARF